jgi:hypothetical protein
MRPNQENLFASPSPSVASYRGVDCQPEAFFEVDGLTDAQLQHLVDNHNRHPIPILNDWSFRSVVEDFVSASGPENVEPLVENYMRKEKERLQPQVLNAQAHFGFDASRLFQGSHKASTKKMALSGFTYSPHSLCGYSNFIITCLPEILKVYDAQQRKIKQLEEALAERPRRSARLKQRQRKERGGVVKPRN